MSQFSLTYKLTGSGWAEAEVSDGVEQLHIIISYIGRSIEAAADAAIALLQTADRSEFLWLDEPGCTQWTLEKQADHLQITIAIWNDRMEPRGAPAYKVLSISTTPLKFAIQVWDALRHLLEEHGVEGYEQNWRRAFPLDKYRKLDQLIRDVKRAAREARRRNEKQSS